MPSRTPSLERYRARHTRAHEHTRFIGEAIVYFEGCALSLSLSLILRVVHHLSGARDGRLARAWVGFRDARPWVMGFCDARWGVLLVCEGV